MFKSLPSFARKRRQTNNTMEKQFLIWMLTVLICSCISILLCLYMYVVETKSTRYILMRLYNRVGYLMTKPCTLFIQAFINKTKIGLVPVAQSYRKEFTRALCPPKEKCEGGSVTHNVIWWRLAPELRQRLEAITVIYIEHDRELQCEVSIFQYDARTSI